MHPPDSPLAHKPVPHPFRRAVLRGLGIILPPLLTIVFFVWVGNTVILYLLNPLETAATQALVLGTADIRTEVSDYDPVEKTGAVNGRVYKQVANDKFVPLEVYELVRKNQGTDLMPGTAKGIYQQYVQLRYLKWYVVVPVFLCIFILLLYLLGKFLAAGLGRFFWHRFEAIIHRLPLVSNVYSSVKQVTDLVFSEQEIEYTRVVAVEYPRMGIWSLAFVTGESMADIRSAANEPVLAILVPTSPLPFTGYTMTIRKSEAIDLDITIDQAIQFIVSCGVVVPPQQMWQALEKRRTEEARMTVESGPARLE